MKEIEIRKQIVDACLYLQKTGLIARTWGNVSARLNNDEFIITPSGLAYENTKEEDLVIVKIDDCSYDKTQRKPSSEKGVHASAYKLRKDINFVVHTHQFYASAICAKGESITTKDNLFIPCAEYGLPSTKTLQNKCYKAFEENINSNMFLLSKHGAIVFGSTIKEALNNAEKLELECKKIFEEHIKEIQTPNKIKPYLDDYAQMFPLTNEDDKEAIKMVLDKNIAAQNYAEGSKPLGFIDSNIQHIIYKLKYSKLRDKK